MAREETVQSLQILDRNNSQGDKTLNTKRAKISSLSSNPMNNEDDDVNLGKEGHPSSTIDVDAIVDEVLRGNVEDFEIRSSPSQLPELDSDKRQSHQRHDSEYEEYYSSSCPSSDADSFREEETFSFDERNDECPSDNHDNFIIEDSSQQVVITDSAASDSFEDEFSLTDECVEYTQLHSEGEKHAEQDMLNVSASLQTTEDLVHEITSLGPNLFVERKIQNAQSPESIMETLGYAMPEGVQRADFMGKWSFVKRFLLKYVYERPRLGVSSIDDVVNLIRNAKRILVLTGAGISVSCGIPDFRSETGLYARIQEQYSLPEPECMFDIEFFSIDPEPFYSFAKELLPDKSYRPSFSHHFIRYLERRGQLLRQFTQNIDTLEKAAGIERVVYCHGSFATSSCLDCASKLDLEELKRLMAEDLVPRCTGCRGLVKPDIVFFGESLPKEFDDHLATDCHEADLVLVMGSSLKVHPVSAIPDLIPPYVPQILINRESLDHNFDIELLGDCDVVLAHLFHLLGWSFEDDNVQIHEYHLNALQNQAVRPTFIEPHYHLFPGAKSSFLENAPPRSTSNSPISSEGLVGDSVAFDKESEHFMSGEFLQADAVESSEDTAAIILSEDVDNAIELQDLVSEEDL